LNCGDSKTVSWAFVPVSFYDKLACGMLAVEVDFILARDALGASYVESTPAS
jgi:hypothetical protein